MNIRNTCFAALLAIFGFMVAVQPVLAQSNPPCAGVSATAFANWPQLLIDPCHTGYNPNEFILNPSNVGTLVLDWKYTSAKGFSTPALFNGVLYLGSYDDNLYALNARTGELLWTYDAAGHVLSSQRLALKCARQFHDPILPFNVAPSLWPAWFRV
jgi:glucose dehydrogenase